MLEKLYETRFHVALKILGRKDWVDIRVNPETGASTHLNEITFTSEEERKYSADDLKLVKELVRRAKFSAADLFHVLSVSKAIADGPKLFRPTVEQCEALENTEIKVPFDFYQQPFPTVIIEIPREYRQKIFELHKVESPQYIICYHDSKSKVIAVNAWFSPLNTIVNIMSPRKKFATIEDSLIHNRLQNKTLEDRFKQIREELKLNDEQLTKAVQFNASLFDEEDTKEFEIAELGQRLGINFSLMMVMLGVNITGPFNTTADRVAKQEKILQKKGTDLKEKQRADRLLSSVVYLTEFTQKIKFYEEETDTEHNSHAGVKTGKTIKPHYRRGHIRLQPYGSLPVHKECIHNFVLLTPEQCKENQINDLEYLHYALKCSHCGDISFRKIKFIKPILVKKDFFRGDVSDTKVEYRG